MTCVAYCISKSNVYRKFSNNIFRALVKIMQNKEFWQKYKMHLNLNLGYVRIVIEFGNRRGKYKINLLLWTDKKTCIYRTLKIIWQKRINIRWKITKIHKIYYIYRHTYILVPIEQMKIILDVLIENLLNMHNFKIFYQTFEKRQKKGKKNNFLLLGVGHHWTECPGLNMEIWNIHREVTNIIDISSYWHNN